MIVVDGEFTGLDPRKHALVSLGALEFENPENQFYAECRVWKGAKIDPAAMAINGFSRAQVTSPKTQSLAKLMKKFSDWAYAQKDLTLAGHNPWLDSEFIRTSLDHCQLENKFGHRLVDLHSFAFLHLKQHGIVIPMKNHRSDISLTAVLRMTGLPKEPEPHNALNGAKLCAEAMHRLLYKKPLLRDFAQFEVPKTIAQHVGR